MGFRPVWNLTGFVSQNVSGEITRERSHSQFVNPAGSKFSSVLSGIPDRESMEDPFDPLGFRQQTPGSVLSFAMSR